MNRIWRKVLAATRWLHIYLSMVGLLVVLFFAITGITLNHPQWVGIGAEGSTRVTVTTATIEVPLRGEEIDRLGLVELLRRDHDLVGSVTSFEADEYECTVVFKRPGMTADTWIDRETGETTITIEAQGAAALLNDLHMGRDTGRWWPVAIDVAAILMAVASLTGLVLLLGLPRRRFWGLVAALVSGALFAAIAVWLVP